MNPLARPGDTPGQSPSQSEPAPGAVEVSVVAPAHNEEDNVRPLIEQIGSALSPLGVRFEFVLVDDGSTDRTRAIAAGLLSEFPWLRVVAMTNTPPGSGNGQSAAFHAGFRAARGRLIAVLDADLQNDPADLPAMLELMGRERADMIQGDRSHARRDGAVRRWGSWVGRKFRLWLLGDRIRDTGCSLRVMRREVALALPLEFRGMHRFIPATAASLGYRVVEMPVNHRPRVAGVPKYGMGIATRAVPGLVDCFAVRWMRSRRRPVTSVEVGAGPAVRSGMQGAPAGQAGSHGSESLATDTEHA